MPPTDPGDMKTLAGKSGAPPVARDEDRARSNEAIDLADLLDAGEPAAPPTGDGG